MNNNFWQKLKKPFIAQAPMAEITDAAFRQILVKYGKPDVIYTEFVSADGLCSEGREALIGRLKFEENERPIVAQFFGSSPDNMRECAKLAVEFGFDGIEVNMGCPDRSVIKQGAGSALIKNPELAREIIRAAKKGAGGMPVSVKTRIGYLTNEIEKWIPEILEEKPAALIIHGRTRKQAFAGSADWEAIGNVAKMARKAGIIVVGNGDVKTKEEAIEKACKYGVDGAMIGRAFFGNPWLCGEKNIENISVFERLSVLMEYLWLNQNYFPDAKFHDMKKHIAMYVRGFDGAKEVRIKLMECSDLNGVACVIEKCSKKI
jgi:nifR3 family TIM-barrel protein